MGYAFRTPIRFSPGSPIVTGRRSLALVVITMLGLCIALSPRPAEPPGNAPRVGTPSDADTPVVAIRGRPLEPHEEPLPAGARVRIGSTRFRHPNAVNPWGVRAVGKYVVTIPDRQSEFTLTDRQTGRRVWTETVKFDGSSGLFLGSAPSLDGRRLVIWHAFPSGRTAARLWRIHPDPDHPLSATATLQLPPGQGIRYVVEAAFMPGGRELTLACNNAVLGYETATGALLSVRSRAVGVGRAPGIRLPVPEPQSDNTL